MNMNITEMIVIVRRHDKPVEQFELFSYRKVTEGNLERFRMFEPSYSAAPGEEQVMIDGLLNDAGFESLQMDWNQMDPEMRKAVFASCPNWLHQKLKHSDPETLARIIILVKGEPVISAPVLGRKPWRISFRRAKADIIH